ncbi:MAG: hypothetical protein WBX25_11395 [Rhodomicrobium sp.]
MNLGLRNISAAMALMLVLAPAQANELVLIGICMPLTTRYSKCVENKVAQCTRSRGVNCKTKTRCTATSEPCDVSIQSLPLR